MTLRAEIEGLHKWLSGLEAKAEPEPSNDHLSREGWQTIYSDLSRVATKFRDVHDAVSKGPNGGGLAEFARDLEREADGLALRAQVLGRRAEPEKKRSTSQHRASTDQAVEEKEDRSDRPAAEGVGEKDSGAREAGAVAEEAKRIAKEAKRIAEEAKRIAEEGSSRGEEDDPAAEQGETDGSSEKVERLFRSAQTSLETAHNRFDVLKRPDAVAKGFTEELDLLAEMTLSLRDQYRRLSDPDKTA